MSHFTDDYYCHKWTNSTKNHQFLIKKRNNNTIKALKCLKENELVSLTILEMKHEWLAGKSAIHNKIVILNRNQQQCFLFNSAVIKASILFCVFRVSCVVWNYCFPNGISNSIRKHVILVKKSMASLKQKLHVPSHKCHFQQLRRQQNNKCMKPWKRFRGSSYFKRTKPNPTKYQDFFHANQKIDKHFASESQPMFQKVIKPLHWVWLSFGRKLNVKVNKSVSGSVWNCG